MVDEKERLQTAQWILEKNLAWIAAADAKATILITLDLAMIGGLATFFAIAHKTNIIGNLFFFSTLLLASVAIFCAIMTVFPRLEAPKKSLVFFGEITKIDQQDYVEQIVKSTDQTLLKDWATQIHQNAKIASQKHGWIKSSIEWSIIFMIMWLITVIFIATHLP